MRILSIETSCDETAISIIEATGNPLANERVSFTVLSNLVLSQVAIHKEYGGVFPSLAKREHAKNLIPLFKQALEESGLLISSQSPHSKFIIPNSILEREPELLEQFKAFIPTIEKPAIDAIAVTYGPGLEPALWVGINFARALGMIWNIPVIPVNHMEGHLFSALLKRISNSQFLISNIEFPAVALLISGGHTELVLMKNWFQYEIIGETKDDAAGEAFDKVARMLDLPYPGGPAISALAKGYAQKTKNYALPRPMLNSGDFNFSFSGLKTAVLYTLKKIPDLTNEIRTEIAHEFQEAVADVLTQKLEKAAKHYGAQTILVGGGVSANTRIQEMIAQKCDTGTTHIASKELTGDNALMIAVAGFLRLEQFEASGTNTLVANGSLRLSSTNMI